MHLLRPNRGGTNRSGTNRGGQKRTNKQNHRERIEIQSKVTQKVGEYLRDGVVALRDVVPREKLEQLASAANQVLSDPSPLHDRVKSSDGGSLVSRDYNNWKNHPHLESFVTESPAAFMVCTLMEAKFVTFYHDMIESKGGGIFPTMETWRQDQALFPLDGDKVCSMWIPLQTVPIDKCPRFAKGSHLWGQWFYPHKTSRREFLKYIREYEGYVGRIYECPPEQLDPRQLVFQTEIKPGDVIIYHMRVLNSFSPNDNSTRKSITLRFCGDDATFARRPWKIQPMIHNDLKPGDPFIDEVFPKVYDEMEKRRQEDAELVYFQNETDVDKRLRRTIPPKRKHHDDEVEVGIQDLEFPEDE